ncbi:hypothetical protein BGLA2_1030018 [Burkholderia gladioli]|nr:hypothetical protein BGLA2_1030018 [Burkholderia gladioli]
MLEARGFVIPLSNDVAMLAAVRFRPRRRPRRRRNITICFRESGQMRGKYGANPRVTA